MVSGLVTLSARRIGGDGTSDKCTYCQATFRRAGGGGRINANPQAHSVKLAYFDVHFHAHS